MIGRIPENILEDILNRVDIVELISGYVPLKRAGKNFKANCPFHPEKTPSFMVSPDRQIYHCFGCGESGNAFKFLMRYERLEFPEAVENLAQRAGVTLHENNERNSHVESLYSQFYKINELTLSFYESNLNSDAGEHAKKYLLKRGVRQESIKLFKLGFALDKWDSLITHLRAKNISLSLLEKAGLILSKEKGGYYDRFRNRIVFPIIDGKSKTVAFGARVLPSPGGQNEDSLPKYINSPETSIYTKGKNLYGLYCAKDAIRQNDYAVVVEGYLDFIIPFQEGLDNIVASLGTALTLEQVRLLKRYTHNVVMIYDGDAAGQIATLRTLDIFIEEGLNVKVAPLPEGFDPDSFVRNNGVESLKEKINNAENIFDYKLKVLKSRYTHLDIEARAKISSEMLATIKKFENAVLRSEYIRRLSEELRVKEDALFEELHKLKNNATDSHIKNAEQKKAITISPAEKLLIKLMLEENDLINRVKEDFEPTDFQDGITRKIVSTMFGLAKEGKRIDTGVLMNYMGDEDILHVICESAFTPEIIIQEKEKIIGECIQRIKDDKLKYKRQYLHEQITLAQNSGDTEKVSSLMQEFYLLTKKG